MATPIEVTAEPVDQLRCKFVLSRPVGEPGVKKYASQQEAADSPVAQAVLGVPGIRELVVSGNVLTAIKKDDGLPWSALEPQVRYAVNAAMASAATVAAGPVSGPADDDTMFDLVADVFESQINPSVAQHGGKVELIDVQDATVVLRMMGGCQGCGMANVTLRQGIEASLKKVIPSLKGIRDITDHASGTDPYFAAETK